METSAVLSGKSINGTTPFTQLSSFVMPQRIGSSFGLPRFGNLRSPSNGTRIHCMQVVNPQKNQRFETLSYVPPLNEQQIAKQVDYIVSKQWIPCLEFDQNGVVFRENSRGCGYYDGRYWTMWKLPMFGCQDPAAVLREIDECKNAYPNAYIRLMAFDPKRQVQVVSFVVHRPS